MKIAFDRKRLRHLLHALNDALAQRHIRGEVYLIGGAVMCLVYNARESTQDLDALFLPSVDLRAAAKQVALAEGVPEDWLNDAAKGYLSEAGEFAPFIQLSHLSVSTATAEYLLAMKCLAMRLGREFHDEADIRYLLRHLDIDSYPDALQVLQRFYPLERFPQKTLYALQEILE
ncbi:MAG TPA: hypothetical protein VL137_12020 [Polyangiaceae bacterium]|jgi:hypothetical protein|nr:hypothetical protein [Polyangiaceae bacterium]